MDNGKLGLDNIFTLETRQSVPFSSTNQKQNKKNQELEHFAERDPTNVLTLKSLVILLCSKLKIV